jgi:chromosomal replication initiator protein
VAPVVAASAAISSPAVPAEPSDDLDLLWERVRGELEASLPRSTRELWLDPLRVVAARGSTLLVSAPATVRAWVERRYAPALLAAVRRHAPALTELEFVAADDPGPAEARAPTSLPPDPMRRFDRFVIGPGNRLAHAAALAVAELPGEAYNPLFLHGPPGLGKSHLLAAIRDYLERNQAGLNVHHTTAERFTNEFVTALRRSGPEAFKARYRGLDALLIDDVQFLEGKAQTAEEFFHTFNALHAAGKQIVLSSDRPPEALSGLAERLRDRFAWGLAVEIEQPDVRTRIAVLGRLATDRVGELPEPAVLAEIAGRVPGNVRVLEGAMTRVLALASLLSEPLSPAIVERALGESGAASPARRAPAPTLEQIQDAVCELHAIGREELVSPRRSAKIARARQLAMYLARELTSLSLAEIARAFDRDHSTVLHAVRAVEGRLEPGSETAAAIHTIHNALGIRGENRGPRDSRERAAHTDPPPPGSGNRLNKPSAGQSTNIHRSDTSDPSRKMTDPR